MLLLALALLFPLRAGDFDLSVAGTLALSGAVAVTLSRGGSSWVATIAGALSVGVLAGLFNGVFVVKVRIHAFILTLGVMTVLLGTAKAVTGGQVVLLDSTNKWLATLTREQILGVPLGAYYGWILAIIIWFVFRYTAWGRHLLVVGGSRIGGQRQVAMLMGLPVDRIRRTCFLIANVISAFAGIIFVGMVGAADPGVGPEFLFQPYVATFLGATTINVGQFNVLGTVLALAFVSVVVVGLQLLGMPLWVANVLIGLALIFAVYYAAAMRDQYLRREGLSATQLVR